VDAVELGNMDTDTFSYSRWMERDHVSQVLPALPGKGMKGCRHYALDTGIFSGRGFDHFIEARHCRKPINRREAIYSAAESAERDTPGSLFDIQFPIREILVL
jgi:hypothetical protein